jgi:DNA mismatch endonuclease (patch repair protein)
VLPKHHLAIFVHGCFWHNHRCRPSQPKTRSDYWSAKFSSNSKRDARVRRQLRRLGWSVVVLWECEVSTPSKLAKKIEALHQRCLKAAE